MSVIKRGISFLIVFQNFLIVSAHTIRLSADALIVSVDAIRKSQNFLIVFFDEKGKT